MRWTHRRRRRRLVLMMMMRLMMRWSSSSRMTASLYKCALSIASCCCCCCTATKAANFPLRRILSTAAAAAHFSPCGGDCLQRPALSACLTWSISFVCVLFSIGVSLHLSPTSSTPSVCLSSKHQLTVCISLYYSLTRFF